MILAPTAATRIAELEADNRRLRRLLEQEDAPLELRHRLRSTVALLLGIIRKSSNTERDLEMYVGHLEDRVAAIVRAQSAADEHGLVDLGQLVIDELLHYNSSEGDRLAIRGPLVELRPRAGQILALAIHELTVNAVEHGALGVGIGTIDIDWRVTDLPHKSLIFTWQERGDGGIAAPSAEGFGTEVLTRMLPFELGAETELAFASDGLRCTIRIEWNERVGRLGAT
jgi:two-component sensor histidine kinase